MKFILILLIPLVCLSDGFATEFFDDFNDGDISDWEPRWGESSGIWWTTSGYLKGMVDYGPAGLCPVGFPAVQDVTVSTYVNGTHAFGVAARIAGDSGILAYVSTDHDVARIRRLQNGTIGDILVSIYTDFPSGVWYDLQLTCTDSILHFTIDCPTLDLHWELAALDDLIQEGTVAVHMGTEPCASWDWFHAVYSTTGLGSAPEPEYPETISIYPNPFMDHVSIQLTTPLNAGEVYIYDLTGRVVARLPFETDSGEAVVIWSPSSEDHGGSNGVYFAKLGGSSHVPVRFVRCIP